MVGRWRSGIPLCVAPTWAEHQQMMKDWADCFELSLRKPRDSKEQQRLADFALMLTGFRYGDDLDGSNCPFGAHIRRANPRDMLDPLLSDKPSGASTSDQSPPHPAARPALCRSRWRQGRDLHGDLLQSVPAIRIHPAAMDELRPRLRGRQRHLSVDRQPRPIDKHVIPGGGPTPPRSSPAICPNL